MAQACETDVEILDERSEWQSVFATAEGETRLEMSTAAQRTQIDGEWAEIDTSIQAGAGGLSVTSPVYAMTFSDGSSGQPLAVIEKDGHILEMGSPLPLTEPVIEGSQVIYPGVLDGVDLVVSVHEDGTGFSQVLRVETPEAADAVQLTELTFPVTTSDDIALEAVGGGFDVVSNASEEPVFISPEPVMWDSSGEAAAPVAAARTAPTTSAASPETPGDRTQAPTEGDTVTPMSLEVAPESVTITPDQDALGDPDTQWPVYIDPSVSGTQNYRTIIRSGAPNTSTWGNNFADQGLGFCNRNQDSACAISTYQRLLWQFNGLDAIAALNPADVISASFEVYGSHAWTCTAYPVELWWTNAIDAGTTWNNHAPNGWLQRLDTQTVTHRSSCGPDDQKPRRFGFNATEGARKSAQFDSGQLTLGLHTNESSMLYWKRYGGDATLSVTYSRVPWVAPVDPYFWTSPDTGKCKVGNDRPFIRSLTPTLFWHANDPDGGNTRGNLDIHNLTTGQFIWDAQNLPEVTYGPNHSYGVPGNVLTDGHSYRWYAGGQDVQTGQYGPMNYCEFTVDMTPPNMPTVSSVGGVYPENRVSGGTSVSGQFDLGNGGSSDVVSYKYSFDNDSLNQTVSGSTARVTFEAQYAVPGSHRLYVQAVDRAGNTSLTPKMYRFDVRPAVSQGWWRMDGTNPADTSFAPVDVNPEWVATGGGPRAGNLTLSGGTSLGHGPLRQNRVSDRALSFDSVNETAQTSGPVIDTSQSFSVMGMVRMTSETDFATAVSQDGTITSGFKLGVRTDASCGTSNSRCFGFWMSDADNYGAPVTKSIHTNSQVQLNRWYHLTGVYDAVAGTIQVYVCDLGPDSQRFGLPTAVAPTATQIGVRQWAATGPFRVGRAIADTAPDHEWPGLVDDVQAFKGAVTLDKVNTFCSAPSQ